MLRRLAACGAIVGGALPTARAAAQTPVPPAVPAPPPTAPVDTVRRPLPRDTAGQVRDTTAAADTTGAAGGPRRRRAAAASRPIVRPPVSPRRAFLSSLLVPGYGQAKLDRPAAGALFVGVELMGLVMTRKSLADLREAKAFRGDSLVPAFFPVDSTVGQARPTVVRVPNVFTAELVRARRLHFEDWLAVLAFNHLFAAAEAFVSANLWDLPTQVSARRSDRGAALAVSLSW